MESHSTLEGPAMVVLPLTVTKAVSALWRRKLKIPRPRPKLVWCSPISGDYSLGTPKRKPEPHTQIVPLPSMQKGML
jgi:hypothetical protein